MPYYIGDLKGGPSFGKLLMNIDIKSPTSALNPEALGAESSLRFWCMGLGFRGLGFRVSGLGDQGTGFRVQGLGFRLVL